VDTGRLKAILTVAASALAAATVSVAGIIGFVGLIVPHIARAISGTADYKVVLSVAMLAGATVMIISDTIARVSFGGDGIPVGVITALVGGPYFLWLLKAKPG
jgi:iron complex transport system permease protein